MPSLPMNSFGHFFPHGPHGGFFPGLPGQDSNSFRDIFRRRQDEINILNATTSSFQTNNHPSFPVSSSPLSASASASAPSSTSTSSPHPLFIPPLLAPTHPSRQDSPASTQSTGSKRKAPASADESLDPTTSNAAAAGAARDDNDELQAVAIKRQRNTMAARKYRQKRLDKIADLERALEEMASERDDLKIRLARREAEVDALKEMLGRK